MAKRRKSCSDKKTGQELARAMVPWHNAVFAADAAVRVAECGAKGLGLVARRDLDNGDVRALTMQFQACGEAVFAQLSDHPSRSSRAACRAVVRCGCTGQQRRQSSASSSAQGNAASWCA